MRRSKYAPRTSHHRRQPDDTMQRGDSLWKLHRGDYPTDRQTQATA